MIAPSVPMAPELKCVSGFCLPRGYKKLETPITEGKYRKSTTSHISIPLLLLVSNHTGKSFSEALILASVNPQYGERLFIECP